MELGYELLATEYVNVNTPMPFICSKHKDNGIQHRSLHSINHGSSCHYCRYEKMSKSRKMSDNEIVKQFQQVGLILQEGFEYNIRKNLPCVCEKHPELGIQYISLDRIRNKKQSGCKQCGREKASKSKRIPDNEIKNIVELLGLEYISTIKNGDSIVECICPKHKEQGIQIKTLNGLREGKGCRYCNQSHGERKIEQYLLSNKICFESQKTFNELVGYTGKKLSYDFFINGNLLIEYQGEQHERYVAHFFKDINEFRKQQEYDEMKRNYAKQKNISLLTIWYYDYNNIDGILNQYIKCGVA